MTGAPNTTRLGSYEILQTLARGGMAEVLLARATGPHGFEKLVVLKKILPHLAENPRFVQLFLDEAKVAAQLDHPHIAQVYDIVTLDGNYCMAMEYVHGRDLRMTLRRGARLGRPFPIEHAVQVARDIAAALHYAHERRTSEGMALDIVHRDVSPSNILISYEGAVKLLDLGVAKATTSSIKTRTGILTGKVAYMSPEQAMGAPIDRRSDVYSLGIVLWELVTGCRLYRADNDLATVQLVLNRVPPPPSLLRRECPLELQAIIMRALAQPVEARYQTARELQLDLEALARRHRLWVSSVALGDHMHELFEAEIRAWRAAEATHVTLTDHVRGVASVNRADSDGDDDDAGHDDEVDDSDELLPDFDEAIGSGDDVRGSDSSELRAAAVTGPTLVASPKLVTGSTLRRVLRLAEETESFAATNPRLGAPSLSIVAAGEPVRAEPTRVANPPPPPVVASPARESTQIVVPGARARESTQIVVPRVYVEGQRRWKIDAAKPPRHVRWLAGGIAAVAVVAVVAIVALVQPAKPAQIAAPTSVRTRVEPTRTTPVESPRTLPPVRSTTERIARRATTTALATERPPAKRAATKPAKSSTRKKPVAAKPAKPATPRWNPDHLFPD